MAKIFVTLHGMKSLLYKIQGARHSKRHFASSLRKPCEVRARFAPSPTGNLHLGGLRTALYNFLFAKSNKGKFILRIEDTDQTRLVPHAARKLENMLSWAKIYPDESPVVGGPFGPYVQSQRLSLYNNYVKNLLENGSAYKCFCTNMRLNRLRNDAIRRKEIPRYDNKCRYLSHSKIEELGKKGAPYCIRFKLETIIEPYEDLIYGSILYNVADHEGDFVIMKSDGYPTYHLANVVDDHLMGITHVLRGVEWQISTPKHLLLYKAFGWSTPLFGHLPLIVNQDGSKLSKRQDDLHIEYYRDQGYFPEAVLNFVTDIGGGFDDREHGVLLSIEDLLEKFNLFRLTKNSCRLDKDKLEQYNQLDLQRRLNSPTDILLLVSQLHDLVQKTYGERFSLSTTQAKVLNADYLKRVLICYEKRIVRLEDLLQPEFAYIWVVPDSIPVEELPAMPCKHAEVLRCVLQVISSISNFNKERIVEEIKDVSKQYGLKIPTIMKLIRMTVTGMKEGPPVGEMLYMLGQDTAVERMKHALTLL